MKDCYRDDPRPQFPNQATEYAYQNALTHWQKHVPTLWPQLNATPDAIWSDLHVTQPTQGEARFKQQYWRGNIDPSERYVLSVKGSTQYRLATDATGFSNLYITGDWLKSGINAGCVEQAVMAGLSTSRAICGQPRIILGEFDFTGH